jgi:FkbM family methyltransferase
MHWRRHVPGLLHRVEEAVPRKLKQWLKRTAPGIVKRTHDAVLLATTAEAEEAIIADGPLRGRRFSCRLRYEADYIFGNHEPHVTEWILTHAYAGATIFDVGAHAGFTALIAATVVKPGRVVAFEPNASNLDLVRRNLRANSDLAPFIIVEAVAVSNASGFAFLDGDEAMGSLAASGRRVETVTLDEYVARTNRHPHLVKMDIEGGETLAFDGMAAMMRSDRPVLIVEIHSEAAHDRFARVVRDHRYVVTDEAGTECSTVLPRWTERSNYLAQPA